MKLDAMEGAQRLGFSTPAQHSREQLSRNPRFVADCGRLAERLQELPLTRQALLDGHLGDAMVELLARKATPETEGALCEKCHLEGVHGRESLLLFGEAPNALTYVTEQWVVRGREKRPAA